MTGSSASGEHDSLRVAPWPRVDFAAFGRIEPVPLTRLQKLAADYMHRNWLSIPHVFHQDEADATELEAIRQEASPLHEVVKVTSLAFIVRAAALTLREHLTFNASLDVANGVLIKKHYVHIGIVVDTAAGLLVPIIHDADKRSVDEISLEIARLSAKARTKGLSMAEMSGGCFSISSLGRSGGTAFTPIINAPEVAILGISRLIKRPMLDESTGALSNRSMLPLTLSYDHRANNGVAAGRFMSQLRKRLETPRALLAAEAGLSVTAI